MAEWCKSWTGTLKDGTPADIRMRPGVTMQLWERAFRDIHAGTQHAMVNPNHHVEWARTLMAPAEPSSP